jgi:hypothetical protein
MSVFHDMRTSRVIKFFAVHAVVAIVAAAIIVDKHGHIPGPVFFRFLVTFVEAFLGSFAGALLSLVQVAGGLLKGFSSAGGLVLLSHAIPMPVVAGIASLGAFVLFAAGIRMYRSNMGYVVMLLSSLLFMTGSYVYFIDMGGNARVTLEQSMILQPER